MLFAWPLIDNAVAGRASAHPGRSLVFSIVFFRALIAGYAALTREVYAPAVSSASAVNNDVCRNDVPRLCIRDRMS